MTNRLGSVIGRLNLIPGRMRVHALSAVVGRVVPFVGTAGLVIESLDESRAVVVVRNTRRVQNHIGGVHAAAMVLVAETATGFLVGMNLPDDKVPVVQSMNIDFRRRAKGDLHAIATLDEQAKKAMREQDKGEITVPVTLLDSEEKEPLDATLVWAWTPKRR